MPDVRLFYGSPVPPGEPDWYVDPDMPESFTNADFRNAVFDGTVSFRGRVFEGPADFSGCLFMTKPDFSETLFKDRVRFQETVFEAGTDFFGAVFERFADFRDATVNGTAGFVDATFVSIVEFENFKVTGRLRLNRALLEQTSLIGPLSAGEIDLRLAVFPQRVRLELRTGKVNCERTRFLGGVRLLTDDARVDLTDAELGGSSLIGPIDPRNPNDPPSVISLTGTDVSSLTLSHAVLRRCRLWGAHNLDTLRLQGDEFFASAPRSAWLTQRLIIWDEHLLRAANRGEQARRRWRLPGDVSDPPTPATATEVLQVYRALRKGADDAKDKIQANDFYYGEMEMRRFALHDLAAWRRSQEGRAKGWLLARAEHLLLWLYWASSGYGLRAWRAFATLAVLIALTAAAFSAWGFPTGTNLDYGDSLRFSLRAATSILRAPEQNLTAAGEWIELVLRFTGPVLFGLAVFALRGRVRR